MPKKPRYDGLGIAMLGFGVLLLIGFALFGGLVPKIIALACDADCLAREDLGAQSSMAIAAWAMALITAVGAAIALATLIFVIATVSEARRSADAAEKAVEETRRIGQAQVRAYLMATPLSIEPTYHPEDWHHVKVRVGFRNSGQSPALNVTAHVVAFLHLRNGQTSRWHELEAGWPPFDVSAGEYVEREFSISESRFENDPTWMNDWIQSEVVGALHYLDVFGEQHTGATNYGKTYYDVPHQSDWTLEPISGPPRQRQ